MSKVCAFTGHRLHTMRLPQDESVPAVIALKRDMAAEIDRLISDCGVTRFLSGLGLGTDIWGAEMVLERMAQNPALELEVVIPFKGQTEKWTKGNMKKYLARYEAILNSGKALQFYTPDDEYIKSGSYKRRNLYLAEHCDYLLAVWNGSNSGTGMTVNMAQKAGKICTIIDPRNYRDLVDREK